jgi:hypothetical protein
MLVLPSPQTRKHVIDDLASFLANISIKVRLLDWRMWEVLPNDDGPL